MLTKQIEVHEPQQLALLPLYDVKTSAREILLPDGYKGLAAFHKYWGKKPVECLTYLIETLTAPGDIVMDPFLGFGLVAREAVLRKRRFIGIDINPMAIDLAAFMLVLPDYKAFAEALDAITRTAEPQINESYRLQDGRIATHYLWNGANMQAVWVMSNGMQGREELTSSEHDVNQSGAYQHYQSRHIRPLRLFQNSRINTQETLSLSDLFTGRALRNIDLLLEAIRQLPETLQQAFLLTLTSAVGQMSRMVFVITGRGKTTGTTSKKIEVGSWVIGYWRPALHFEINVWNCFAHRAAKVKKAIQSVSSTQSVRVCHALAEVVAGTADVALKTEDCRTSLAELPENSVSLILTDPPHSDRIPYLELSELWNAIMGHAVDFDREIVVSNAHGRHKTKERYNAEMTAFFANATRVLKTGGYMAILFNARDQLSWTYLRNVNNILGYQGCFPMRYSATSVIQDNRKGGMKHDYVLIYQKSSQCSVVSPEIKILQALPGWSIEFPTPGGK
jgi:hypothetical protein